MKVLFGSLVLCLGLGAAGATQNYVKSSDDPFTGAWKIDWSKSRYIDELKSRKSSPESPGPHGVKDEVVTYAVANNAQYGINDHTFEDGTKTRWEYTATYNDNKWYQGKNSLTGKPTGGWVMMVRLEPRRELSLRRNDKGAVTGLVLRTVLEDGKTMNIISLGVDGTKRTDIILNKQ